MSEHMILDAEVVPVRFFVGGDPTQPPTPGQALPLERWLALRDQGEDLSQCGVLLEGESDPHPLVGHLNALAFVAINFSKFADGRGYSHARRLRTLWGYKGPIVAVGDVLRDQLHYMQRCGFNGFLLRDDQDAHSCMQAFSLFSAPYHYDP